MAIGLAGHSEKRNESGLSWRHTVSGVLLVCALSYLVFAQGGYYGTSTCFAGVLVWVGLVLEASDSFSRFSLARLSVSLLLFALAVWYLAVTLIASPTATSLLETGTWFAVVGVSFLAVMQTQSARVVTLKLIACLGLATALIGLFAFSGLITFEDALYRGRLQSTFQYANTAAIWFGASGILCFTVPQKLRAFSPACFVAMLLCQSAGATISLLVVLVACGFIARTQGIKSRDLAADILFAVVVSLLGTALILAIPSSLRIVAVLFLLVVCLLKVMGILRVPDSLTSRLSEGSKSSRNETKVLKFVVVALAAVLVALVLVLFWGRIHQAAGTFAMRLVYDMDALSALATSPLFGLGPDMWKFLYPQFQSAQYSASLVHCGYLQIAVDAGLPALCLFVAAVAVGIRRLFRAGSSHLGEFACVLLIAVHSLVDFDLSFGVIALLLGFLLALPLGDTAVVADGLAGSEEEGVHSRDKRTEWGFRTLLALCVAAGLGVCFWASSVYSDVQSLSQTRSDGGYAYAIQEFEGYQGASSESYFDNGGPRFVANDPAAQEVYLTSCLEAGSFDRIERFCESPGVSTSAQTLSAFEGLYLTGDEGLAMDVLIDQLEKEPYNYQFYKKARKLVHRFKSQGDDRARFEAAVSAANEAALNQDPLYPKAPKLVKL